MCCRMKPPMLRMAILSLSECEPFIFFVPAIAFNSFSPFFVRLLDTFAGINIPLVCCVPFLRFVFIVCVIVD